LIFFFNQGVRSLKNSTKNTSSIRFQTWPVLALLMGALTAICLPVHAAEAVAPAKKASAPASDKVAPGVKAAPHNTSNADKKGKGKVGPGPNPPGPKPEQAVKVKKKGQTSKVVKKTKTPAATAPAETPAKK
jgi:hypothetical protein